MPRSDEAASFYYAVYSAVQEIPPGKVTSYGHIAVLIGMPQRPRQVGVCLKHLPAEGEGDADGLLARFHGGNVPWQRVLSAKGVISPRGGGDGDGRQRQAAALEAEGVEVTADAMGVLTVDLARFGWFPRQLPSEAATAGSDGGDGEDED
ncbi:mgmt family protein [Niveomyces insectorum RCEF 264]|uniref:Mgmt family protein n=1 Tax=Niveomyces insectorum RCEF 264 TaxID=1081102 RepID=A0A167QBS4_9HYPO|nr:mgmt family protein [Niveomyces insectorum RCEF 264]